MYAWYLQNSPYSLSKRNSEIDQIVLKKNKFCNFIYSNPNAQKRIDFFYKLSQYKKVDSGGALLNNIGGTVSDKLSFINNYKFTIAFENSSYPGYTTEKIVQPMMVRSIPIYWGNELIYQDFNTKSFLNYHDYSNEDQLINRIIEVDQNIELYRQYLLEPYFHNNRDNIYIHDENVLNQFEKIFGF